MATTTSTPPPTSVAATPDRLLSLDVLRGFTMAAMVLVNDPGSGAIYTQLDHVEWNGATFTDMIFPCFMVMVGMSMTLSFASRLNRGVTHASLAFHAIRRGLTIVLIGLVLNVIFNLNFAHMRYPGVLQRIGTCYTLAALLYLALPGPDKGRWRRMRELGIAAAAVLALVTYWALLKLYPVPGFGPGHLDTYMSLPAYLDRAVFTTKHIWRAGVTPGLGPTYDPEGLLSTLPALTNVLFGILAGEQLRSGKPRRVQCGVLASMGTLLWLLGLVASHWLPLNKKLWTSSFALFTSGLSILALAGFLYVVDLRKNRRGWDFLLIFGTNAILAYILSDVVGFALDSIRFQVAGFARPLSLHGIVYRFVFASWLTPKAASAAFALFVVCLIALLVFPLYRRRIFLRI